MVAKHLKQGMIKARSYTLPWLTHVSCIELRVDHPSVVTNAHKSSCRPSTVVCEVSLLGLEERICYFFSDLWDVPTRHRAC